MARRIYVERNGRAEGWGALIVIAVAVVYAEPLITIAAGLAMIFITARYLERREDRKLMRLVNSVSIGMEADHQDMLYRLGDPAGVYGRYEPMTMPITAPTHDYARTGATSTVMDLDDYDDGLREWL